MTTVAYIANEFPSPLEPYVMDEIYELRRRGVRVICCSGKTAPESRLNDREREFWLETQCFQPLAKRAAVRAVRRLFSVRESIWDFVRPVLREIPSAPFHRVRSLGHTVLGAELAEFLALRLGVQAGQGIGQNDQAAGGQEGHGAGHRW